MDSCTGKTEPRGGGRGKSRAASQTAPNFLNLLDCASVRGQLGGADDGRPIVPARCGRGDAVAKLIGNRLGRIEKLLRVVG